MKVLERVAALATCVLAAHGAFAAIVTQPLAGEAPRFW